MKIAVMGTGGVGGYFGGRLAEHGQDVTFIARGAHLTAIRDQGLRLKSVLGDAVIRANATDDPATVGPVDVVLFTVKLWDVEEAGAAIRPMVGPETAVIALQNGIDAEERLSAILGQQVGPRAVMGGVAHISARIAEPGLIEHNGKLAKIFFGELGGQTGGKTGMRGEALLAACKSASIDAKLSDSIERVIWEKFIFLIAFSGMTAVTRKPIGPIREDAETWAMFRGAMAEAAAIAAARKIAFKSDPVETWSKQMQTMPFDYRASMLEDLEHGRRLELPWLSGKVAAEGRRLGIPTPVNSFIATVLKLSANP